MEREFCARCVLQDMRSGNEKAPIEGGEMASAARRTPCSCSFMLHFPPLRETETSAVCGAAASIGRQWSEQEQNLSVACP